jgi:hypothetical protein
MPIFTSAKPKLNIVIFSISVALSKSYAYNDEHEDNTAERRMWSSLLFSLEFSFCKAFVKSY